MFFICFSCCIFLYLNCIVGHYVSARLLFSTKNKILSELKLKRLVSPTRCQTTSRPSAPPSAACRSATSGAAASAFTPHRATWWPSPILTSTAAALPRSSRSCCSADWFSSAASPRTRACCCSHTCRPRKRTVSTRGQLTQVVQSEDI